MKVSLRTYSVWLMETDRGNLALLIATLLVFTLGPLVFSLGVGQGWTRALAKSSIALSTALILLLFWLGDPRTWWSPFFGTTVVANMEKLAARERAGEDGQLIQEEIAQWVQRGTRGSWISLNPYSYRFLRRADAVFFKLTWG